jgi:hypothetical protein
MNVLIGLYLIKSNKSGQKSFSRLALEGFAANTTPPSKPHMVNTRTDTQNVLREILSGKK